MTPEEQDRAVRIEIFRSLLAGGGAPGAGTLAERLSLPVEQAKASLTRLAESRAIVLKPGTHELWMANPFSCVATDFVVESAGRRWYGNCVWDSFGIVALAGGTATIRNQCPDCQQPQAIEVRDGRLAAGSGVVHFAVPAGHWWDDIGYT